MIQYFLTGLAGLAIGIVIMRLIQARPTPNASALDCDVDSAHKGAPVDEAPVSVDSADPSGIATVGLRNWTASHKLLAGAGTLGFAALMLLLFRSPDQATATKLPAALSSGAAANGIDDVDTMISRLAARLEKNPGDGEGFRMLGWSYVMTAQPEKAIAPCKRAMTLLPDSALVHSGYGEALVGVATNKVTDEAREHFTKALTIDPSEPRARYFVALWLAQNGQEKQALEKWLLLANSSPAEASWQPDLRARIAETAKKLGVDVSARLVGSSQPGTPIAAGPLTAAIEPPPLDPSAMQAAGALPPAQQQAMIDGMVEGLAKRLKENPGDADGWARLLRSRMVLKQTDKAAAELKIARTALAGNAEGLSRLNASIAALAVHLVHGLVRKKP